MRRHIAAYGIGMIVAIALGSGMGCDNGLGPATVPEPHQLPPPASPGAHAPPPAVARVTETAAQTPPLLPWHDCLNDVGGVWQVDDSRRCVATQSLHVVTGWSRHCRHNRAHFPDLDWRCCVDDGSGQCVPGSEVSYTDPPEGSEGSEGEQIQVEEPQEPAGPRVWIHGTSPQSHLELCEGDFIAALGVRRSDTAGELRGSVSLVDLELAELEETGLPGGYTPLRGEFAFADGEDDITSYSLDQKRIGKCPKCSELREVRLGIDPLLEIEDQNDPDKTYAIGDDLIFRIRKASAELCQPE